MREALILMWCDACNAAGQQSEATDTITVRLGSAPTRSLDLCADHMAAMVAPLSALLDSHGAADEPTRREPAPGYACPECGHLVGTTSGLRDHRKRKHAESFAAIERPHVCPECSAAYNTPQGLGAHRKRMHGVAGKGKAA